mmetsp:Transcript_31100/g.87168  ORF Transcript_31100/g.87168 Transcript_31100/m.87168 type:complete len:223 (+) Transcript_31100:296-964(+)
MRGMLPPSLRCMAGFSKNAWDASWKACSSHAGVCGAAQPAPLLRGVNVTVAPRGGSRSSSFLRACSHWLQSASGAMRRESVTRVRGRKTFPAVWHSGIPSQPTIASCGDHHRCTRSSSRSEPAGCVEPWKGKASMIPSRPSALAAAATAARRWSESLVGSMPGQMIRPVLESSTRSSSWRTIRNEPGTTPEAFPEWTPSPITWTHRSPTTIPRSELVIQSCS